MKRRRVSAESSDNSYTSSGPPLLSLPSCSRRSLPAPLASNSRLDKPNTSKYQNPKMGGAKKKEVSSSSEDSDDDNEESDDESHLRVKLDGSFNNTTTYQLPR